MQSRHNEEGRRDRVPYPEEHLSTYQHSILMRDSRNLWARDMMAWEYVHVLREDALEMAVECAALERERTHFIE